MNKAIDYLKSIINKHSIVVVGVSGGPDSMCLLHLLLCIKKDIPFKIVVAHMNHKQRKESEEEKEFVKKYALDNELDFEYYELKKNIKNNFHAEARIIRYQFFNNLINKYHANYLMTAHHGDDLMETILMRIERGSTLKGYSGFDLEVDKEFYKVIHPLIFYSKEDIKKYMDDNNLEYRIDNTNYSDDYLRNRYRHHILPFLKEEHQDIHLKYYHYNEVINEADSFINKYVLKIIKRIYKNNILDLNRFKKEDILIQKRIIEYILNTIFIDNLYVVTNSNTLEIIRTINNKKNNIKINLPLGKSLIKAYDILYISNYDIKNNNIIFNNEYHDEYQSIIKIDNFEGKSNYYLRLDSQDIKLPLILRKRLPGDRIFVKHMTGSKKVKDIFIDEKIPQDIRDNILLLTDSDNKVLWIPGIKKSIFDKELDKKCDIILKYETKEEKK